jgi:hypothetical protein
MVYEYFQEVSFHTVKRKKHAHFLHEPCKKDVLLTVYRRYAIK